MVASDWMLAQKLLSCWILGIYIPINILEFCPGVWLNYFEKV
jgi:hypothetical protein